MSEPDATRREAERIRSVFQARDRASGRHPAIADAYRRLNVERLAAMEGVFASVAAPSDGRILDVGCGAGHDLARLAADGWLPEHLAGVDLVRERVERAREACPGADIRVVDGTGLPFADRAFDVATAVTVFSSILDPAIRRRLFAEMERVVRPGGIVVVYDFVVRKPTNPNVIGLGRSRLVALAGRLPEASQRLSPLLHLVAAAGLVHSRLAGLAMRVAPRTHRLSYWRVPAAAEPGPA